MSDDVRRTIFAAGRSHACACPCMGMDRRTPQRRTSGWAGANEVTRLFVRAHAAAFAPVRRLAKVPVYVSAEAQATKSAAEEVLRQRPRRGRYLLMGVLGLLMMAALDGAVIGRMTGWWGRTTMLPRALVPGVFVPAALRAVDASPLRVLFAPVASRPSTPAEQVTYAAPKPHTAQAGAVSSRWVPRSILMRNKKR